MANYNVDIEVALRGAAQLKTFRENLSKAADQAERLQNAVAKRGKTLGDVFAQQDKDRLKIHESLIKLEQKALGIDKESIKNNNAILDQKAEEFAQNERLINQEKVRQSIADKRRRVEGARGRQQAVGRGLENALIGGAFPLLFGQGAGAAVGGAAGGFGGGLLGGQLGFGLSLAGTALGSQFDRLAEKAFELGKALNPLTADTEKIISAVGRSDTQFASLVQELEAAGESAFALELATRELEEVVGKNGVEAFSLFSDQIVNLQNETAILTTKIGALVAEFVNALTGQTPFVQATRERMQAVSRARASDDPEIQAAVAALDALGPDPKARIAQQEKIVDLLENGTKAQREALRLRQLDNKLGKDQGRIIDQSTQLTKLNTELISLGTDRYTAQGIELQKQIARQTRLNDLDKAYKDFAEDNLTTAGLRAKVREVEANFAQQIVSIDADAAEAARKADERSEKSARRKQRAIENRIKIADREIEKGVKLFNKADQQLDALINKHKDKVAFEREYAELIANGSTPAAAQQAIELKKQQLELDRNYEKLEENLKLQVGIAKAAILEAKARGASSAEMDKLNRDLIDLQTLIEGLPGKKEQAEGAIISALAPKSDREELLDYMTQLQGAINDLNDPVKQIIGLSETLGSAFSESFKGIISGSMTAREALANLFQRTADHFLDMAAQMIAAQIKMQVLNIGLNFLGGLGGGASAVPSAAYGDLSVAGPGFFSGGMIPGFANGGRPPVGRPSIVGERGPELFVPDRAGTIVPNHAMGSTSIVVNVDASGSSVEGEAEQSRQLGKMLGAAVQAELIKQKRPGGLLAT